LKLKEKVLDRTLRRTRFGRGYWPVVRQHYRKNGWMNIKLFSNACSQNSAGHGVTVLLWWWIVQSSETLVYIHRYKQCASPRIKVTVSIFERRDCVTQFEKLIYIYMILLVGNLLCLITASCATFTGYNATLPKISFTPERWM
jgi:hypothetical protein